ncbi:MAG TPA: hypothetical protein VF756_12785 [Thermoanaerobaculia bacterium]
MDNDKLTQLIENVKIAKARRDSAARQQRDMEARLKAKIALNNVASFGLTVGKEILIYRGTSLIGRGFTWLIRNSKHLVNWTKQGSKMAQRLLRSSQQIGNIAAEWLVNGVRGDLRGALLGTVATLPKSEKAGALLAVCLATSEAALEAARNREAQLLAQGPRPAPELSFFTSRAEREAFEILWKEHFKSSVENLVWSRCYEMQQQVLETYLRRVFYPDPLHPVRALEDLEEAVQQHKTGTDVSYLDGIAQKADKLVEELRQHGIHVRKPYPGEGPLARIASIFEFLDYTTRNELAGRFRRYNALRRSGRYEGMYHWWDKEGRTEIFELLKSANIHLPRRLPFMLGDEEDEQATNGR